MKWAVIASKLAHLTAGIALVIAIAGALVWTPLCFVGGSLVEASSENVTSWTVPMNCGGSSALLFGSGVGVFFLLRLVADRLVRMVDNNG